MGMLQKQGINSNNFEFTTSPANDGVGRGFKQQKLHDISRQYKPQKLGNANSDNGVWPRIICVSLCIVYPNFCQNDFPMCFGCEPTFFAHLHVTYLRPGIFVAGYPKHLSCPTGESVFWTLPNPWIELCFVEVCWAFSLLRASASFRDESCQLQMCQVGHVFYINLECIIRTNSYTSKILQG